MIFMQQYDRNEMEVLFALLADRYERGSIVLTSNLPFSRWEEIFKDPMTTAAAIDRLVHHSVILELNVVSYRLEHAQGKFQIDDEALPEEEELLSVEDVGTSQVSTAPNSPPIGLNKKSEGKRKP